MHKIINSPFPLGRWSSRVDGEQSEGCAGQTAPEGNEYNTGIFILIFIYIYINEIVLHKNDWKDFFAPNVVPQQR